jgi:hypothetical protein
MVMMPQWEFLDFLAEQARRYSTFHLRMETEVTGLIEEDERIVGARGNSPAGPLLSLDGTIMSVAVTPGPAFQFGPPNPCSQKSSGSCRGMRFG